MDFIDEEITGSLICLRELLRSGPALAIGGVGRFWMRAKELIEERTSGFTIVGLLVSQWGLFDGMFGFMDDWFKGEHDASREFRWPLLLSDESRSGDLRVSDDLR